MKYLRLFEKYKDKERLGQHLWRERNFFVDYMMNYYNEEDGIMGQFLNREIIEKYVDDFIKKRKELNQWDGDSFDRELFRDILLIKLGIQKIHETEYKNGILPYLTDLERDAIKYNL